MTDEIDDPNRALTRFEWGAASDVGRVRETNQDAHLARDGLFVVADGMGGHSGGEVASTMAIEVFSNVGPSSTLDDLIDAVLEANAAIYSRGLGDDGLAGMGTTLCAVGAIDESTEHTRLGLINVGDSRIYRFDGQMLEQVTEDHSLVQAMVRDGQLSAEEALTHPSRNVVTRALGISDEVLVDNWEIEARPGERYILCSDGLFGEVADGQIASVLRRLANPQECADELVRLANEQGAHDNVTVVVVGVVGEGGEVGTLASVKLMPPMLRRVRHQPDAASAEESRLESRTRTEADVPGRSSHHESGRKISRFKTIVFIVAVIGVLALGALLVGRYARDNYFVGFDPDSEGEPRTQQLVIFQGRPGGVLWFDPTIEERTPVLGVDLTEALLLEVSGEPEFDDIGTARTYVAELVERSDRSRAG